MFIGMTLKPRQPWMPSLWSDAGSASKGKWMTQIFQTNITVMKDADGTRETFTVPTENERKDKHENYT